MPKVKLEVEASKELLEVGDALVSLIKSIKEHSKDGFNASDIPAVITENLQKVMNGVAGMEVIPEEYKQDPKAFAVTAGIVAARVAGVFLPEHG